VALQKLWWLPLTTDHGQRTTDKTGIVPFGVTREQGAFCQVAEKPLALSAAAARSQGQLVESKVPGFHCLLLIDPPRRVD